MFSIVAAKPLSVTAPSRLVTSMSAPASEGAPRSSASTATKIDSSSTGTVTCASRTAEKLAARKSPATLRRRFIAMRSPGASASMPGRNAAGQGGERLLQPAEIAEAPVQPIARAGVGERAFVAGIQALLGKPGGEPRHLRPDGGRGRQLGETLLARLERFDLRRPDGFHGAAFEQGERPTGPGLASPTM